MRTEDMVQISVSVVAIVLQVYATVLARPLKKLAPKDLWMSLMMLNLFVLARRALSLAQVGFGWKGEEYEDVAVFIGLAVSIYMLTSVINLRKHLLLEKQIVDTVFDNSTKLAKATVELAVTVKAEDSGAYNLAMALIKERENRDAHSVASMSSQPPST